MRPTYSQTLDYLYARLPMFQRIGAAALKNDLINTLKLCDHLGNPQEKFKSVHVAGTNGKGSSCHMLSAILQTAGYKTGLYTSPHLKSFTERIRIDGNEINQEFVVDFVEQLKPMIEEIKPSFFEVTVAMAFDYFAKRNVDVAILEVGLGGRLDSTNVVLPIVSFITNIGFDHKDLLGNDLPTIASEKAGIIKKNVPVVISERQAEVSYVFDQKASSLNSKIVYASDSYQLIPDSSQRNRFCVRRAGKKLFDDLVPDLKGVYQQKNIPGVLEVVDELRSSGFKINDDQVKQGIGNTTMLTGLKGRWQQLSEHPLIYCDVAHNAEGLKEVLATINTLKFENLIIVIGMVKDKDVKTVLSLMPKSAYYIFCEAKLPRALNSSELAAQGFSIGLRGETIPDVNEALTKAKTLAHDEDLIFVGGSTFVVAEIEGL